MVKDNDKPWDARLLERIQRGSSEARGSGKGKWTPKQRAAYAVFLIAWMSLLVSTNGRGGVQWWPIALIVVVVVVSQVGMHFWEHRRTA